MTMKCENWRPGGGNESRTHRHTQEAPMSRTHICNVTSSGSAAGNPSCLGGGTLVLGWPASNKRWNKHCHTKHNVYNQVAVCTVQVTSVGTQCTCYLTSALQCSSNVHHQLILWMFPRSRFMIVAFYEINKWFVPCYLSYVRYGSACRVPFFIA